MYKTTEQKIEELNEIFKNVTQQDIERAKMLPVYDGMPIFESYVFNDCGGEFKIIKIR